MKLTDRINVLIQATTLSQKSGTLNLDEAVKAKAAIDIILSGVLNQNFTSAINILIEIAILSQKKGIYSLKDAHMIYLAIDGFESEFQNEINKINSNNILEYESNNINENELISKIHQYCIYESFINFGWIFTSYIPAKPEINIRIKIARYLVIIIEF